ncbi:TonB-dependent receptor, partial [Mitsuaria sp. TWR114]|uniref:TonB-dependent receptor n=1 Tax=Mitsuaria sp. TWR114 TaxID=2601731 RepID=UPI00164B68A0
LQPLAQWQTTVDVYQIDIDDRILLSANLSLPTALRDQLAAQGVLVSAGRYFTNALDTRTRGVDVVSTWQQDWGRAGRASTRWPTTTTGIRCAMSTTTRRC